MKGAILAVGSELLGPERAETNSLKLAAALEPFGVTLLRKSVVGDLVEEIAEELARLVSSTDLVIVTGGLGPTSDDVTRQAVARLVDRPLVLDPEVLEAIEARFREFGRPMPAVNRRQAEVIEGAHVIPNPWGTAPGLRLVWEGATIFLLPGVPRELEGLIEKELKPWLGRKTAGPGLEQAVVKVACVPESQLEEWIAPAYEEFGRTWITVLAKPGEILIQLKAEGEPTQRRQRLQAMSRRIRELVGEAAFAWDPGKMLEGVVGELLVEARATLTVAESCTGGLLAQRLTAVAGSSAYFLGGVVSYSNQLKSDLLGVEEDTLATSGAVSQAVARQMAAGVRQRLGSTYGLGITGVAGPSGGSAEKPVGTVHMAVAGPQDRDLLHRRVRFPGDRQRIRWPASQCSLELLRRQLLGLKAPGER